MLLQNFLDSKSRRIQWAVYIAEVKQTGNKILVGKSVGDWSCGRPRSKFEDDIKKNICRKIDFCNVDWIELSQDWVQGQVFFYQHYYTFVF